MRAIRYWAWFRSRRRWTGTVGLALLVGLIGAVVLTAASPHGQFLGAVDRLRVLEGRAPRR